MGTFRRVWAIATPTRSRAPIACRGDDRWVVLTIAADEHWRGFSEAAGNPSWCHDPRFSSVSARIRNQDALDPLIEGWTLQHEHREAAAILQSYGVPAGPVLDDADAYADPHLRVRGFFVPLSQADCGDHLYPGPAWKLSATPVEMRHPPGRCLAVRHPAAPRRICALADGDAPGSRLPALQPGARRKASI